MAWKMQTYDEMSTTKGHPWVPQESQDNVLRSPNVEQKNVHVQQNNGLPRKYCRSYRTTSTVFYKDF